MFPLRKSQVQRLTQISDECFPPSEFFLAWNSPFNDVVDDFRVLLSSKHNCVTLFTHKSHPNVFISTFSSFTRDENQGFKNSLKIIIHLKFIRGESRVKGAAKIYFNTYLAMKAYLLQRCFTAKSSDVNRAQY